MFAFLPSARFETVLPQQGVRVSKTCKLFLSAIRNRLLSSPSGRGWVRASLCERPGEGYLSRNHCGRWATFLLRRCDYFSIEFQAITKLVAPQDTWSEKRRGFDTRGEFLRGATARPRRTPPAGSPRSEGNQQGAHAKVHRSPRRLRPEKLAEPKAGRPPAFAPLMVLCQAPCQ